MHFLFGKEPEPIGYVKSCLLGIFVVFNINREDTLSIIQEIESMDPEYSLKVNVNSFCKLYCDEYESLFKSIWKNYISHYSGNYWMIKKQQNIKDDEFDDSEERKSRLKKQNQVNREFQKLLSTPPYFEFICFVLFIMMVSERDVCRLVFWLWFHLPKVQVDKESLISLVNEFWGNSETNKKKKKGFLDKIKTKIKIYESEDVTAQQFQTYDWRIGGPFSFPCCQLLKSIRTKLIGESFWKRVSDRVASVIGSSVGNIKDQLRLLKNPKIRGRKDYRDLGERKISREKMKSYFRFVYGYELLKLSDEESISNTQGSFLQPIRAFFSSSVMPKLRLPVLATVSSSSNPYKKQETNTSSKEKTWNPFESSETRNRRLLQESLEAEALSVSNPGSGNAEILTSSIDKLQDELLKIERETLDLVRECDGDISASEWLLSMEIQVEKKK